MEISNYSNRETQINESFLTEATPSKSFMANVFLWMFVALGISAVSALVLMSTPQLLMPLYTSGFIKLVMFLPLIFVLTMSFAFNRLSFPVLMAFFIAYSVVNGISFSVILLAYSSTSVISCFSAAAVMFGVMAFMGYRTDQDLTTFGRIMFMGLIGMVVVSIINFFIGSDLVDYIIGFVGVLVFTGLTAYDVQKLKRMAIGINEDGEAIGVENQKKLALMGALTLYLDFINLFLSLLRVFGRRN